MKTPNLFSAQKQFMNEKERRNKRLVTATCFLPLIFAIVMLVPYIIRKEVQFVGVSIITNSALLAIMIWVIVVGRKRKFLKLFTNEQLEHIENECLSAPQYEGVMVTSDALMYFMPIILALPIKDIVWVYPLEEIHRKGIMLQQNYYTIRVIMRNKKQFLLIRENRSVEKMNEAMVFLKRHLEKSRPNLIIGYTDGLGEMYKRDFNHMVQISENGTNGVNDDIMPKDIHGLCTVEVVHA